MIQQYPNKSLTKALIISKYILKTDILHFSGFLCKKLRKLFTKFRFLGYKIIKCIFFLLMHAKMAFWINGNKS